MAEWNYAEVWEPIADAQPDWPAQIHGSRVVSWKAFDKQADALADVLLKAGLQHQAKVAAYLHNCTEFLTVYFAAYKAGLVPFNVNYRYGAEELVYLLDNADAEAVVFGAEFAPLVDSIRSRLPLVKLWIAVDAEPGRLPEWALDWAKIVSKETPRVRAPWGRRGSDVMMLYTGGTTGMPKGVMWAQENLFGVGNYGANPVLGLAPLARPEDAAVRAEETGRPVSLIACPLMHGTGLLSGFGALTAGGAAAFLPSRHFSAVELWDEVERLRASRIVIVGMAFCTPMLEVLEANPGRWDVSSVRFITSSGAMWSYENKQGLLKHMPQAVLADAFSSSEAIGLGSSMSVAGAESATARFLIGEHCAVFTEDGRRVEPGSGERGLVAVGGHLPLGYYKDPEKTARTFPVIEGRRWSMPGDWATVEKDGSLVMLGRGSQCINTGGEKVFPEEVEEALKRHPDVRDAAVVGLPEPRFGETVCALVEPQAGAAPNAESLTAFVRTQLAHYKAPRQVFLVDTVGRAPNGKLDYKALKAQALKLAGKN